jgi:hypothetical protein
MLLAVAVVFLLLTFPNSIYFVLEITYSFNKTPINNDYYQWLRYRRLTILTVIMFQLSDLQHATNFFLYLLTSDKFRRSVVSICRSIIHIIPALLTCWCQRKKILNPKLDKNRYGMSFRSSVSDMSTILRSSQYKFSEQHQTKAFYKYRSVPSKSITTTIDSS